LCDSNENKSIIKEFANELGSFAAGFAEAIPLNEEFELYKKWLDLGYNASMKWLEKDIEKRRNPNLILPQAKTVIVFAFNYFTGNSNDSNNKNNEGHHNKTNKGKISRYAWGCDYHEILLPKLKLISQKIRDLLPNSQTKEYVDTGYILEKQWAVRAGIGWQGKNACIINKDYGSYFFLGTIITDVFFEPDVPVSEHCGNCTKCLEKCPTAAIVQPKVIDSRKCLAFWTVEAKANVDFPDEITQNLNGQLFGCDICQEVCPWNSKAKLSKEKLFYPRENENSLDLDKVLALDKEGFASRFKNSPIKRLKLEGLKRNVKALKRF